ncbi:MAG: DUF433 domain-containing protein [Candidatus Brocadia sp.]|nr:MAG: DUF433 domain-containing protein [Candidatus Brocadia sp.]
MAGVLRGPFPKQSPRFYKGNLVAAVPRYVVITTLLDTLFEILNLSVKYQEVITIEPGKRCGKPCIRGMRITVYDVLSYLAAGMTTQDILKDFSCLTKEDIQVCLGYAADRDCQLLIAQ